MTSKTKADMKNEINAIMNYLNKEQVKKVLLQTRQILMEATAL